MKKLIYLLLVTFIILNITYCDDYFEDVETDEIVNDTISSDTIMNDTSTINTTTTDTTILSDSLIIQITHDADSVIHGGIGDYETMYWHFDTLYLQEFNHYGYFNDWWFEYDLNTWIYPQDEYTQYLRGDKRNIVCKRDTSYSLKLGYIIVEYSFDELFIMYGQMVDTRVDEDTIKIYLSDYVPVY